MDARGHPGDDGPARPIIRSGSLHATCRIPRPCPDAPPPVRVRPCRGPRRGCGGRIGPRRRLRTGRIRPSRRHQSLDRRAPQWCDARDRDRPRRAPGHHPGSHLPQRPARLLGRADREPAGRGPRRPGRGLGRAGRGHLDGRPDDAARRAPRVRPAQRDRRHQRRRRGRGRGRRHRGHRDRRGTPGPQRGRRPQLHHRQPQRVGRRQRPRHPRGRDRGRARQRDRRRWRRSRRPALGRPDPQLGR